LIKAHFLIHPNNSKMVAIIDYGLGNPFSIENMISRAGGTSVVTSNTETIESASQIILPGVGSFDEGMANLQTFGLYNVLHERVVSRKVPFLGICLGMQLLSKCSEEGKLPGFGWIDSQTVRFAGHSFTEKEFRIPHMGWTEVEETIDFDLISGVHGKPRFYFVHSYHVVCNDPADVVLEADYGIPFTAAINRDNIYGVQFHPEKSHKYGLQLIENFLSLS
jgi:imidazole glycerol-phosphate synthase subunit HisH